MWTGVRPVDEVVTAVVLATIVAHHRPEITVNFANAKIEADTPRRSNGSSP